LTQFQHSLPEPVGDTPGSFRLCDGRRPRLHRRHVEAAHRRRL